MSDDVYYLVLQFRVPGPDEEGLQVSHGNGRAEHPRSAARPGAVGRPAGQDTEGARRIPGTGEDQLPKVPPTMFFNIPPYHALLVSDSFS